MSERKALRSAKGPVGQERAARRLYRAYLAAAEELGPLAPKKSAAGTGGHVAAGHRGRVSRAERGRGPAQQARVGARPVARAERAPSRVAAT